MTPSEYEMGADEPLYASPGEPIEGELLKQLLGRQSGPSMSDRKRQAWVAYDIYRGRLSRLIYGAILLQQRSNTLRKEMERFVTSVRNDAVDVTEKIAVVWKNGAERHFGADSDPDDRDTSEQENNLRDLARESMFDIVAEQINHLAWLQGPQFAIPMLRDGRLCVDVIGPHVADIVQNIVDPLRMPVAIAWHLSTRKDEQGDEHMIHVLDQFTLRRFKVRRGQHEQDGEAIVHGYTVNGRPALPAACLRFSLPLTGDDWWLVDQQNRLTSGTVEVGVQLARLQLVRKTQCHKLLTVVGDLSGLAKGQEGLSDPEQPVVADTGPKPQVTKPELDVLDFNTPPDDAIKQVLFWVLSMVEPLGGHIQVDAGQPDIFGKIVIPPTAQAEHRKRQLPSAAVFEANFWAAAAAIMRAEGDLRAAGLPPPEDIRTTLRVNFGALSLELEDTEKAMAWEDWQLSRGQTSEIRVMQRSLGGVSADEAKRQIQRNMDERAWFNDLAARSNLSTDPSGNAMTAPQANGAQGTPMREAIRAASAVQGNAAAGSAGLAPEPT